MITQLYFALFCFGLAALFLNVVRNRIKNKVSMGDGGVSDVQKARTVHGNYIETVPVILALMFFMEQGGMSPFIIHAFGLGIIASRILHIIGIYAHHMGAGKQRTYGSVLFILLIIAGGGILVFNYFV